MSRIIRIFLVLIILTVAVGGGYMYYTESLPGGTNSWFSFMSSEDASDKQPENLKTLGFQANIVEVAKEAFDFKNLSTQNASGDQKSSSSGLAFDSTRMNTSTLRESGSAAPTLINPNPNQADGVPEVDARTGGGLVEPMPAEDYISEPYEFQVEGNLPEVASELAVYQKQVSKEFQNTSLDLSQIIKLQSKKLQNVNLQDGDYSVSLDFVMGSIGIYKSFYDEKQALKNQELMEKEQIVSEDVALASAKDFLNRFGINVEGLNGPKVQKPEKWGGCPPNARCMMQSSPSSTEAGNASVDDSVSEGADTEDTSDDTSSNTLSDEKRAADSLMIWPGPIGYSPYIVSYSMEIDGNKVLNQGTMDQAGVLSISVNSASGQVENLNGWISAITFQKSNYPTLSSEEIMKILQKGGMYPSMYWGEKKELDPVVFDDFSIGLVEYPDWQNQTTYFIPTFFAKAQNPNTTNEWDKNIIVNIPLISHKYLPFLPDYNNGNGGGVPMPLMEKSPL